MKSERQERILELIAKYEIETQDEMMARLKDEGFAVTQATVSRDLRELKLTKTLTPRGTYRYTVHQTRHHSAGKSKFNSAIAESVVRVDYSMNTIVLKTYPGMAQAVASGVDAMNMDNVLGCVAGDDTIIVITRNEESAAQISGRLLDMMKNL